MPRDLFSIPLISEQFGIREVLFMSNSKSTGLNGISVKLLKLSIQCDRGHFDAYYELFNSVSYVL